ncbi:hypothetical protein SLEP1_g46282 [Rubroshorea leprosula]|uniref:Uncharacterized protein n=1 Tax=Rubroshorea leprosula TaxID=152421 RepID=A0AAV5LNN9_9ROSI|nr:hypothetical protein SLEP1_g46282 [Rubroshorea leprosula]
MHFEDAFGLKGAFEKKYGASIFSGRSEGHGFRDLARHIRFERDKHLGVNFAKLLSPQMLFSTSLPLLFLSKDSTEVSFNCFPSGLFT